MTQLTHVPLSPDDAEILSLVASRLDRLLGASQRVVSGAVATPVADSRIEVASRTAHRLHPRGPRPLSEDDRDRAA